MNQLRNCKVCKQYRFDKDEQIAECQKQGMWIGSSPAYMTCTSFELDEKFKMFDKNMTNNRDTIAIYNEISKGARQTGRTTALAKAAEKIGAHFIVSGYGRSFPNAVPYGSIKNIRGTRKPIIFDHHVIEMMLDLLLEHKMKDLNSKKGPAWAREFKISSLDDGEPYGKTEIKSIDNKGAVTQTTKDMPKPYEWSVGKSIDAAYPGEYVKINLNEKEGLVVSGDTHLKGDLTVDGDLKMNNNMDSKIKEKQEKINQIVSARRKFIKKWMHDFLEIDKNILDHYILDYRVITKDFRNFILKNVQKKQRKVLKKGLEYIRIRRGYKEIEYGKRYHTQGIQILSGVKWNFVKKILAIIKKYACLYANEILKTKYSDLTSKYDVLLYDEETSICERCGTENPLIAIFCNNCGKRF